MMNLIHVISSVFIIVLDKVSVKWKKLFMLQGLDFFEDQEGNECSKFEEAKEQ